MWIKDELQTDSTSASMDKESIITPINAETIPYKQESKLQCQVMLIQWNLRQSKSFRLRMMCACAAALCRVGQATSQFKVKM